MTASEAILDWAYEQGYARRVQEQKIIQLNQKYRLELDKHQDTRQELRALEFSVTREAAARADAAKPTTPRRDWSQRDSRET